MIVGEKILEVNGTKNPGQSIKGLNINISIDNVEKAGDNLEITYSYTANYDENAGQIKIKGVLVAKEDDALTKEAVDSWKKDKKLPQSYTTNVLTALNYSGSANGTLVARVLGLTAPLIPPRIQLSSKPE
ncbi:hypothetical protein KKF81_03195 [Candidatus Micrarchaeota archaeon]|nr:hypothetical protein [Candidatus Micrarchaeota archaeon]MBU1165928.1 hypothetical protein [Candidatus Micrarchaeota archaeon]MBU1887156.1 hypothetical protein [Candidatus Micrarchaeota archaeon]